MNGRGLKSQGVILFYSFLQRPYSPSPNTEIFQTHAISSYLYPLTRYHTPSCTPRPPTRYRVCTSRHDAAQPCLVDGSFAEHTPTHLAPRHTPGRGAARFPALQVGLEACLGLVILSVMKFVPRKRTNQHQCLHVAGQVTATPDP